MLTPTNARERVNQIVRELPSYPGGHEGRGIVIPGGGVRYFTCAWVCVHMLRRLGCTLPIQLWHLGCDELTPLMRSLIEPLGVVTVDALEVRKTYPARILNGWEMKSYSIIHSPFAEVLLLDADNMPVVDPTFLFETPQYGQCGAIFWPDYMSQGPGKAIWTLMSLSYRNEPEVESGQLVIDKRRCWAPLSLAMWMNEHSDFWYRYFLGDKETFHFGWRKLDASYAMPNRRIKSLEGTMCQHDFDGRRIFQHRNLAKWSLGDNRRVQGFLFENECFAYVEELRRRWRPLEGFVEGLAQEDRVRMQELCGQTFQYVRIGFDERPMQFREDGLVVKGTGGCETLWWIEGQELVLAEDRHRITCRLRQGTDGVWEGTWLVHERMPVRLEPIDQ